MKSVKCTNTERKTVRFCLNGHETDQIIVTAIQDGEYWFQIGMYKTLKNAKKQAVRQMKQVGYTLDQKELDALTIESLL